MLFKGVIAAVLSAALVAAQSDTEVVGVFLWGRHGDRTSKIKGLGIEGSSVLTTLGMNEVFETGQFWSNMYYGGNSTDAIQGLTDYYQIPQIYASAPNDNVLLPSAISFWQGFYPPSAQFTLQTLSNGTSSDAPLNGYQYVTVNGMPADSPDLIWIAGDQSCPACTKAQDSYYNSTEFLTMAPQLQPFYNQFIPLFEGVLNASQISFANAYNVFDYINVGYIHNATIFNNVSAADLFQLRTLADNQLYNMYYNASQPDRSIGGQMGAYLVLSRLNMTAAQTTPALKLTYFVSAYSTQMPFWALTNMTVASPDFYGLPDYASTMTFELRRPSNSSAFDDLFVRFGFRNGSDPSTPVTYFPMFGSNTTDMPWSEWSQKMSAIAIPSQADWCNTCNSTQTFCTGVSAASTTGSGSGSSSSAAPESSSSSGLSNAAAGGIGAGVTIGVIAIVEGLIALWYLSNRKKNTARLTPVGSEVGSK